MYKKLREELINDNILLLDRLKSMKYEFPTGTLEENMIKIDKDSQEILKQKFGYGEIDKKQNEKDLKSYYFITINLEGNKEQIKDLYDKMLEALHRYKWLRKSIFNIEYYTKKGGHPHSHLYVDCNKRRDTIIWLLSKFFNIKKNYLDVKRYYGNPINHINYIKGIKKEENKEEYIDKDDKLRDEYNIPKFIDNMGGSEQVGTEFPLDG